MSLPINAALDIENRELGKELEKGSPLKISVFLPSSFLILLFICCLSSVTKADLTVASAISMSDALEEISKAYTAETGEKIRHTFSGTNVLARQIEAGAPIDVFVSADTVTMDELLKKKFILESTIRTVATNQLVAIVPTGSKLTINSPADLLSAKRIAIADPSSVPAGIYAKKWLDAEDLWAELEPKTIPLQNVRAALLAVSTGNADVGIVYRSDAASTDLVKISFTVPWKKTGQILYPAAVVRDSPNKSNAAKYLTFLETKSARAIFEKHGFEAP